MDSKQFLHHVKQEIARLEKIRALLEVGESDEAFQAPAVRSTGKATGKIPAKKQSAIKAYWAHMTPAQRTAEMNRRMKLSAKKKAAAARAEAKTTPIKTTAKATKKVTPGRGMSEAGRQAVAAAQRKRWAAKKAAEEAKA